MRRAVKSSGGAQFVDSPALVINQELGLTATPVEVGSFVAQPGRMYVVRAEVYADDGADPTFRTYVLAIGNGVGGNFVQVTAQGALNFSLTAGSGGPGEIPINLALLGAGTVKTRIVVSIDRNFPFAV